MVIGWFGKKFFEVSEDKIYTPQNISFSREAILEEEERNRGVSIARIKGIKPKTVSFEIKLDCRFVDVYTEIDEWQALVGKIEDANVLNIEKYLGVFYLTKCDIKNLKLVNHKCVSATISLSFVQDIISEEEREKSAEEKSESTSTSTSTVSQKVDSVKKAESTTTSTPNINIMLRKGSIIRPKKNTRWYYTAEGALKQSGRSGKAQVADFEVYNIYPRFGGKVTAVNAALKGWLKVADVDVIKY